ncbi:hypothetical protein [Trinickia sp. EG282A]|uniref:hypothetical protein n=1 Tax=Trinickia sp. EG282A TaxID=3237013 RepID=UPI0034D2C86D
MVLSSANAHAAAELALERDPTCVTPGLGCGYRASLAGAAWLGAGCGASVALAVVAVGLT